MNTPSPLTFQKHITRAEGVCRLDGGRAEGGVGGHTDTITHLIYSPLIILSYVNPVSMADILINSNHILINLLIY